MGLPVIFFQLSAWFILRFFFLQLLHLERNRQRAVSRSNLQNGKFTGKSIFHILNQGFSVALTVNFPDFCFGIHSLIIMIKYTFVLSFHTSCMLFQMKYMAVLCFSWHKIKILLLWIYYVENTSFIVRKMLYLCRSIGVVGFFQKTAVFQKSFCKIHWKLNPLKRHSALARIWQISSFRSY